ncbi:MAG: phosphodiester glycosidase family protein [Selenomonas sp.]|jgi:exopolysaccharide biosynthesis protein|nr:phosphodiester glycosidase family protein [Selenomonas sp.]
MNHFIRKSLPLALGILLALQSVTFAASANLDAVRYHSGSEHDRVVFDLSAMPDYSIRTSDDGKDLIVDFQDVAGGTFKRTPFHSSRIESVKYSQDKDHMIVTLRLKAGLTYRVNKLNGPARVFVDILPKEAVESSNANQSVQSTQTVSAGTGSVMALNLDGMYTEMAAPGIAKRTYVYWDDDGKVTAYFLEADKNLYKVKPVLAQNHVPGLQTTSGMSDANDAVAAINATYFAGGGDMIGMVKIDGQMAGTTYYNRTAFGIMPDGRPIFGRVSYSGTVTLGSVSQPVGGVDCERGENSLVIYNKWYGSRTRTNEYGMEYVVRNGRVTAINTGNSDIPADGCVISVHGTAADAYSGIKVGDRANVQQDIGSPWNEAVDIMGAGPCLVHNGQISVTAADEEFPSDIRYGRAPRSAVAVLRNGNYLFAVVDGRQECSHGLTLTEWAVLLKKVGAQEAMNLDGGGSSDLVVGGQVQNSPSDGTERYVGSALIVVKK